MINDKWLLSLCLLFCFLSSFSLSYIYTSHYGIVFGMSDIDRYNCMWNKPTIDEECTPVKPHTFFTHLLTFFIFGSLNNPQTVNYLINLFVWALIPLCFYVFSREWLDNKENAVHTVFYFMFGTYIYYFFGFMLLLAQLTSFIFYLLSLRYLVKEQHYKALPFILLAILGHPYILAVYILYFISLGIFHRKYNYLIISFLLTCLFLFLFGSSINFYMVFGSGRPQPSLYDVFFIFINPLLTFFFFVGLALKKVDTLHIFTLLLLIIAPFTGVTRALPFLLVMMVNYGFIGFKHSIKKIRGGWYLEWVLLVSFLLHFLYLFDYFTQNMVEEMYLRGLNPVYFLSFVGG